MHLQSPHGDTDSANVLPIAKPHNHLFLKFPFHYPCIEKGFKTLKKQSDELVI